MRVDSSVSAETFVREGELGIRPVEEVRPIQRERRLLVRQKRTI